MRTYEIVVVYNPDLSETALKTEAKKIKDLILSNGGSDLVIESWGRREFSYPMNNENYGYYLNFIFGSDNNSLIAEIQRVLTLTDSVVRYQTLRTDVKFKKVKPVTRRVSEFDSDTDDFIQNASMN